MEDFDVIVVGAGIAGLIARRELQRTGARVCTLEARDRVGGRTWTAPVPGTDDRVDLGAEWVSPRWHQALMSEYSRYGIDLDETDGGRTDWIAGGRLRSEEDVLADIAGDAAAVFAALDADARRISFLPRMDEVPEDLDIPFSTYLDDLEMSELLRTFITAQAFSLMGADTADYAASDILREIAGYGSSIRTTFEDESYRVVGGADALAHALAAEGDGPIRLEAAVTSISPGADGVVVRAGDTAFRARVVVVAVPVNVVLSLDIEPAPEPLVSARGFTDHAGRAAKVWYDANGIEPDGFLFGGAAAHEAYAVAHTDGQVRVAVFSLASEVEAARDEVGDLEGVELSNPFSHDWVADPHARGSWMAFRPGQLQTLRGLQHHEGPVLFCGGDIADGWLGWMDGAVTSGYLSARHAITQLARDDR